MNKKPFALLLLLSIAKLNAKTLDTSPKQTSEKGIAQQTQYQEQAARPLDELLPDFFNELDRSIRSTTVDLMASMQEELGHLHKRLETMNKQLKADNTSSVTHKLTEEADKITLGFILPKDIKYEPSDIEVINNRILRLEVKDEKYTVTIGITLDRNILSGHIKTETEEQTEKGARKAYGENRFRYGVNEATAQFDKITADYNQEKHTLTFTIPKDFKVENKRTIKVAVNK